MVGPQSLEANRLVHVDAPWYAGRALGAAVGGVLLFTFARLAILRPPAPE